MLKLRTAQQAIAAFHSPSIYRFFGVLLRPLQYAYADDFAVKPLLLSSGIQKDSILSVWAVACSTVALSLSAASANL
jgi:hypothetical protein